MGPFLTHEIDGIAMAVGYLAMVVLFWEYGVKRLLGRRPWENDMDAKLRAHREQKP